MKRKLVVRELLQTRHRRPTPTERWTLLVIVVVAIVFAACGESRAPLEGDYFLIGGRAADGGPSVVVGLCPGVHVVALEITSANDAESPRVLWRVERRGSAVPSAEQVSEITIGRVPSGFEETQPLRDDLPSESPIGIRVASSNGGEFTDRFVVKNLDPSGGIAVPSGSMSIEELAEHADRLRC